MMSPEQLDFRSAPMLRVRLCLALRPHECDAERTTAEGHRHRALAGVIGRRSAPDAQEPKTQWQPDAGGARRACGERAARAVELEPWPRPCGGSDASRCFRQSD